MTPKGVCPRTLIIISRNHSALCLFLIEAWTIYYQDRYYLLLLHHDVEFRNLSAICG